LLRFTVFAQEPTVLYDYILKETSDRHNFEISVIPNENLLDSRLVSADILLIIEKDNDIEILSSPAPLISGWTVNKLTAAQLSSISVGDGSKDFYTIISPDSNEVFTTVQGVENFLFALRVNTLPVTGSIEILDNDNPIVVGINASGAATPSTTFNIKDSDTNPTYNKYNGLTGTTSYEFNDPTLSNDTFTKSTFSLTPNPNNGQFTITSKAPLGETTLIIFNIAGQQVYRTTRNTFGKNTLQVNLSQKLAVGAYLISVENNENKDLRKMIVN